MCCRVFNKTIIRLRLAGYEMIYNQRGALSYPARPRRIFVKYIYIKQLFAEGKVNIVE